MIQKFPNAPSSYSSFEYERETLTKKKCTSSEVNENVWCKNKNYIRTCLTQIVFDFHSAINAFTKCINEYFVLWFSTCILCIDTSSLRCGIAYEHIQIYLHGLFLFLCTISIRCTYDRLLCVKYEANAKKQWIFSICSGFVMRNAHAHMYTQALFIWPIVARTVTASFAVREKDEGKTWISWLAHFITVTWTVSCEHWAHPIYSIMCKLRTLYSYLFVVFFFLLSFE